MACCEDAPESAPTKYVIDIEREGCALIVMYSDNSSKTISIECNSGSDGDPGEVPEPTGTNKCAVAIAVSDAVINQWAAIVPDVALATSIPTVAAICADFIATNKWPIGAYPALLAWATAGNLSGLHNNALGAFNVGESAYRATVQQAVHCCLSDDADFNASVRNCARTDFYDPLDVFYQSFQTFWLMFPLEISRTIAIAASNIDPNDVFCDECTSGVLCTVVDRFWQVSDPWEIVSEPFSEVVPDASNFTLDWWQGWWSASGQPNTEFGFGLYNGKPASANCVSYATCRNMGIIYTFPDPCTVETLYARSEHVGNNTVGRGWFVKQGGVWRRIKQEFRAINGPAIPTEFNYKNGVDGAILYDVEAVALISPQGGGYWYVNEFGINVPLP